MAVKKSELYNSLWDSCDQLRGSMDASQYKDYILVLLFMKYVSDKHRASLVEVPEGAIQRHGKLKVKRISETKLTRSSARWLRQMR